MIAAWSRNLQCTISGKFRDLKTVECGMRAFFVSGGMIISVL